LDEKYVQHTTKYTKKQANSTLMMNESQKMSWMKKNMSNTRNIKTKKTKAKYLHGKEAIRNLLMDERNNLDEIMSNTQQEVHKRKKPMDETLIKAQACSNKREIGHEHRDQSRRASVAADELPMRFPWLPLRPPLLLFLLLFLVFT
jgi:hypothetical protein